MTTSVTPARLRPKLLEEGVTDAEIRVAIRRQELVRLSRGTYALGGEYAGLDRDRQHLVRALAEATRTGATDPGSRYLLSHVSAALLHGLPVTGADLGPVHLTRAGRGGASTTARRRVHVGLAPRGHRTMVDGWSVTSVARTLVDLGRTQPLSTVVVAADAAVRETGVTSEDVLAVIAASSRLTGAPAARRALQRVDGRSESPGETRLRLLLEDGGLPVEAQVRVLDERGRLVGRPDLALVGDGVLLEFDGLVKYQRLLRPDQTPSEAVVEEKRREERLSELGWLVLRFVWADLEDSPALLARVRQAQAARRPWRTALRGSVEVTPRQTLLAP